MKFSAKKPGKGYYKLIFFCCAVEFDDNLQCHRNQWGKFAILLCRQMGKW